MAEPTPSQTVGPYFSIGLLKRSADELVASDAPGAIHVAGSVVDGAGEPVPDAVVELWQADAEGSYRPDFGWGRASCEPDGRFSFWTVKPGAVDGQAPHLTLMAFARGLLKPVLTRMYFPDEEEANARDHVFSGVADPASLVARPTDVGFEFDIRLQGDGETVFFAL